MSFFQFTKTQSRVILTVTFGNILEWFEIYSYAYLAPILARVFFNFESSLANLISSFIIFGSSFLIRPFGGILFGRIGDLIGRKKAYILSITIMTIPTFLMGCLPAYAKWGIYSPILLGSLRLLQSIPASGEVPGTICFLYENSGIENRKFITSWTGVGNQIGAIIGVVETFIMDQFMSNEFLISWGWRISFWTGGLIGLFGIYLRRKLFETPQFEELKKRHLIGKNSIHQVLSKNKKGIGLGIAYGIINASTFYLIATYIPSYFGEKIGLTQNGTTFISLAILILTTVLLPVFGIIGDKFDIKSIMISSAGLIILLLPLLYFSIETKSLIFISLIGILYIIPITCISALLAYLLAHLFPTPVRFTGVGLTWNIADGIFGSFTPAIALLLLKYTANDAAFCWYILVCGLVSFASYFCIKKQS